MSSAELESYEMTRSVDRKLTGLGDIGGLSKCGWKRVWKLLFHPAEPSALRLYRKHTRAELICELVNRFRFSLVSTKAAA